MGSEIMAVGVDSRKRWPWFTSFKIEKIGVWCEVMVAVSIATSLSSYVDLYCPGMSRKSLG